MSSFTIELTRNGKPNLVYKNYKYRESYTVQSGETIWRCLGRDCGASIKTDVGRTSVTVTKAKHVGPHPVTMRNLTSLTPRQRRAESATSSPVSVTPTSSAGIHSPAVTVAATVPVGPPLDTFQLSSAPGVADLVAENTMLREKVLHLEEELHHILDHSIESDIRLMQYTNEVFVANSSRCDPSVCASVADCAVQCDPPIRAAASDCAVQCDLPTSCRDERCSEVRALVQSLKTTIEVLEADLLCLKSEVKICESEGRLLSDAVWTTVRPNKRKHLPTTENRYQVLSATNTKHLQTPKPALDQESCGTKKQKKRRKKPYVLPVSAPRRSLTTDSGSTSQPPASKPRTSLSLSSVIIEGDSHSRDVAGHVRQMVTTHTTVTGDCKPGAKFLTVISDRPPPPGSCTVIIAGTNDLADSQQCNIYRHLEHAITSKLQAAKVVVSTLPYRHDLPASHPIHLETALVNAYIEELCARHRGAEVLDFNTIDRSAFTKQGMHLKPKCKHLLAELLVECLKRLDGDDSAAPPPPIPADTPEQAPSRPPPARRTLLLYPVRRGRSGLPPPLTLRPRLQHMATQGPSCCPTTHMLTR